MSKYKNKNLQSVNWVEVELTCLTQWIWQSLYSRLLTPCQEEQCTYCYDPRDQQGTNIWEGALWHASLVVAEDVPTHYHNTNGTLDYNWCGNLLGVMDKCNDIKQYIIFEIHLIETRQCRRNADEVFWGSTTFIMIWLIVGW